jgi:hypothetical protein
MFLEMFQEVTSYKKGEGIMSNRLQNVCRILNRLLNKERKKQRRKIKKLMEKTVKKEKCSVAV